MFDCNYGGDCPKNNTRLNNIENNLQHEMHKISINFVLQLLDSAGIYIFLPFDAMGKSFVRQACVEHIVYKRFAERF